MNKRIFHNKKLTYFSLLFILLYSISSFSQIPGHTNLPPTEKKSIGKYKYIDYEYKLKENNKEPIEKRWINKYSDKEFKDLKNTNQELYNYYYNANRYFERLSNRVKSTYTLEELWYIYMFDQGLKNKLSTIK
jgi:hypothetical protein